MDNTNKAELEKIGKGKDEEEKKNVNQQTEQPINQEAKDDARDKKNQVKDNAPEQESQEISEEEIKTKNLAKNILKGFIVLVVVATAIAALPSVGGALIVAGAAGYAGIKAWENRESIKEKTISFAKSVKNFFVGGNKEKANDLSKGKDYEPDVFVEKKLDNVDAKKELDNVDAKKELDSVDAKKELDSVEPKKEFDDMDTEKNTDSIDKDEIKEFLDILDKVDADEKEKQVDVQAENDETKEMENKEENMEASKEDRDMFVDAKEDDIQEILDLLNKADIDETKEMENTQHEYGRKTDRKSVYTNPDSKENYKHMSVKDEKYIDNLTDKDVDLKKDLSDTYMDILKLKAQNNSASISKVKTNSLYFEFMTRKSGDADFGKIWSNILDDNKIDISMKREAKATMKETINHLAGKHEGKAKYQNMKMRYDKSIAPNEKKVNMEKAPNGVVNAKDASNGMGLDKNAS